MTTIEERLYEGARAREILDNEQFHLAFDGIEKEVMEQWTNSPARDQEGRERLWTYLQILRKVKSNLMTALETGKLAELDLMHKRTLAERAKDAIFK